MQFNPVVLFVEMPVYRIFVTKIQKQGEFGQIIQKSEKQKTKKTSKLSRTPRLV